MTRTAGEIAQYLKGKLNGDENIPLNGVASPESATTEDLIYVQSAAYASAAQTSASICVLAASGLSLAGKTIIEVSNPKLAFAKAASWILPQEAARARVHETAVISSRAKISPSVHIGAYVVIEDDVEIGEKSVIEPFCFLGKGSRVGEGCRLHPRVTLYAGAILRDRVELHSGVVIGGDGFGYVFGEGRHWKFPQIGGVEIGNDVEIGCNATIDRGSLGRTEIGEDVKIDNLVQIGHNVRIGAHSIIVSQTGISGSATIGKNVMIGGQAGLGERCVIEDGAMVGGQAGVLNGKTIRKGQVVWGTPARPLDKFKEQFAWMGRLPALAKRLRSLADNTRDAE
jgi:UDP-3-O-[3-hydroxymyristoyl] glucosamine N-acyltransferase